MDYKNGKIYRLVCNETGLTYYGSTTQSLVKRKSNHKRSFDQYLKGNCHFITCFDIIKNDNYDIILVEDFPCERKAQLLARERYWIENNDCVNKCIPNRSVKEWRHDNREHHLQTMKEYYTSHRDEIMGYQTKYRKENPNKVREWNATYRQRNTDEIKRRHKLWRENNKEKIKEWGKKYKEKKSKGK